MSEGVKAGDVWESVGGKLRLRVDAIDTKGAIVVRWSGINRRESGICSVVNFPRGRVLVMRDGALVKIEPKVVKPPKDMAPLPDVRVGDVWESGAGRKSKVTTMRAEGWCGFTLLATKAQRTASLKAFVKGRKLIERDGKAVAS